MGGVKVKMEATEAMSKYETISTILSIIAIALSILIPLIQWIWKKMIMTAKLNYYPTGQATLLFNQSGSYIRFNGVLESQRKAATIKNMSIVLTRKHDEQKLNLVWSYFISPVNQSMLGNYVLTMEAAHPFRVEADSVTCAFVEYSDPSDSSGKKIRKICLELSPMMFQILQNHSYDEALSTFSKSPEYINAKNSLLSDFYWEMGKYTVDLSIKYDKQKTKTYSFDFIVSEQNYTDLRNNIDESLVIQLKEYYHMPRSFNSPMVEVSEIRT